MKGKKVLISTILCLIIVGIFLMDVLYKHYINDAVVAYKVYLNGETIGLIDSDEALYDLINKEQEAIRLSYNVENVYPPSNLEIVKTHTYSDKITPVENIYKKIEDIDSFTIKGYIIEITNSKDEVKSIHVLDRSVFEDALKKFVHAFVDEEVYQSYMAGTQEDILETGSVIDKMYFRENITIKEGLVSVKEKIYSDATELSQYLLFGEDAKINIYRVKKGDTLETIADSNKLNVQELLISNSDYRDENTILAIGDTLNVTYLNPVINFVEEVRKIQDVESVMETKTVYDNTKPSNYSEITVPGVKGITRLTQEYQIINGEPSSEVIITDKETIREAVTQVVTKGNVYSWTSRGEYVDTGLEWGWPTNMPYIITSYYTWRWGKHHDGIDISGTGLGSPIYSAGDGEVVAAGWEAAGGGGGESIKIAHYNGYYTIYAHMIKGSLTVKTGDIVKKGQIIGRMGSTGFSTGPHLHFGVSYGAPYHKGSYFVNPLDLYK